MSHAKRRDRLRRSMLGRAALTVMSWGYGLAVGARRMLYDHGVFKSKRLPAKVICIGNLTAGGTGKTPAVLLAAQTLRRRNLPVAILSRGYGRGGKKDRVTALIDEKAPPWTDCGDEPWMMHQALSGMNIPILVCSDRAKAGEEAINYYHSRLLILDDGFQHHKLKRDLDIVLVSARDPFGGGSLLPLGDLREPPEGLSRAHMIVITHADMVEPEELERLRTRLKRISDAPILESAHKPDFLLEVKSEKRAKLAQLQGRKIVSFCGLGDPAQFEALLSRAGAETTQRWRYPDHHAYSLEELKALERLRGGMPAVTTWKDFVRFPEGWRDAVGDELYVLSIKLEILKGRNLWIDSLLRLAQPAE